MAKKKGNNYIIGTENNIAKIEITRRNKESIWALIDLEDLERVINFPYTWSAKYDPELKQNYVETTIYCGFENGKKLGKSLKLHKFIMYVNDNRVVDHINHDTLDNRKSNLTVEECIMAYMKAKRNHIREKVKQMEKEMPEKVKSILLAW